MESNGAILSLEDVALTLESAAGAVNILRGVDLSVAPGETLGVVGPSGSGKSTLMSVIAGLERPTSGSVSVAGRRLGELSEDELALFRREHVGIVFQSFHLIPTMTAIENVAIALELAGRRDAFTAAGAMLERVGLEDRLGHHLSQLSGGEQQRVALARAFAGSPDLVLADEPTGNLDSDTGAAIVDLMFDIQTRDGSTLLLISHDDAVVARCSRIVQMNDGRLHDAPAGRP